MSDIKSGDKSEKLGANLKDILKEHAISEKSTLGGWTKKKDKEVLLKYFNDGEVICSRHCFLGSVVLLKGQREYFVYCWVASEATQWGNPYWKRLTDLSRVDKLFNNPDTKMYNQEAYNVFLRTLMYKALQ